MLRHCRNTPTIVHVNSSWRGNFLPHIAAARCLGAKVFLTEHTVPPWLPEESMYATFSPWRIRRNFRDFRKRLEWLIANRIIAVGDKVKMLLHSQRHLPMEKTVVIRNGIDTERFSLSSDNQSCKFQNGEKQGIVVGFTGRIVHGKRLDCLLHSVADLKRDDITILIVGEGPAQKDLHHLAKKYGFSNRFFLAGYQEDVVPFLRIMDVFVLPSEYEAMPFSVLEAMACGVPVIASNVGGISEIVEDGKTGFLISPGDVEMLTKKLFLLSTNPSMRHRFGIESRRRIIKHFSEIKMVQQIIQLYKNLPLYEGPLNEKL
jgi:glycosyltransferase involved in cell wall biosynthesis